MIIEKRAVPELGGEQEIHRFGNGYGASVVRHQYSRGGDRGLWELAVLKFPDEGPDWGLTYETPITDDVIGYLTDADVQFTLAQIELLPSHGGIR